MHEINQNGAKRINSRCGNHRHQPPSTNPAPTATSAPATVKKLSILHLLIPEKPKPIHNPLVKDLNELKMSNLMATGDI